MNDRISPATFAGNVTFSSVISRIHRLTMFRTLRHRRSHLRGFTLVEMLIVIAALSVIAGLVVPQVEGALVEAQQSAMLQDLHGLTAAIERFRLEHTSEPPVLEDNSLPQLLSMTDGYGNVGTGPEYTFGPYLRDGIPENPLNGSNKVFYSATSPPANLEQKVGWIYHTETGQIWGGTSRNRN